MLLHGWKPGEPMNSSEVDFSSVQVKAYLIRTSIMHPVLEILGDPWNLTLARSLLGVPKKFVSLTQELKISRAALSTRLSRLEEQGCLSREQYCESPPRYEYKLTPMGDALRPILLLLEQWNREWLNQPEQLSATVTCQHCQSALQLTVVCRHCSEPLALGNVKPLFFQTLPEATQLQAYRRTRHTLASKDRSALPEQISAEEWLRDRWSSLIIGALLFGVRRFIDMQSILDIAPNILSGRLELLQQAGMTCRRDDGYRLLPRGAALYPAIIAMSGWGRKWLPAAQNSEQGWRMLHISCGNWADHTYQCQACKAQCN
jgi:DNA-binding HxlR family transcriptional regulator